MHHILAFQGLLGGHAPTYQDGVLAVIIAFVIGAVLIKKKVR